MIDFCTLYILIPFLTGKTIQAIALMLQNRPDMSDFAQLREWAASDARHAAPAIADSSTSNSTSSSEGPEPMVRCGTLIVLPTVAIRQWQTEIARFTKEGSLTVKVYHGSDRNTSALDLTKTDIVLTSYKVSLLYYCLCFCCEYRGESIRYSVYNTFRFNSISQYLPI